MQLKMLGMSVVVLGITLGVSQAQQAPPVPPGPAPLQVTCETKLEVADNYTTILLNNTKTYESLAREYMKELGKLTQERDKLALELAELKKHVPAAEAPKEDK